MTLQLKELVLLVILFGSASPMKVLHTFFDPGENRFQHLTVNAKTGHIFLGATNRLHKLSSELTLLQSASVGPRLDNPDCPPPVMPCPEDIEKRMTESRTKGIVIDKDDNALILCSSLFHGHCQRVSLDNITRVEKFVQRPMVPNDESSCVMFIAPSINMESALYIAATYSSYGKKVYRDMVPSLSSRRLDNLEFVFRDANGATRKNVLEKFRTSFKIRYVDGFSYDSFVYFISVQKEKPGSTKYVSRISRICQNDTYFYSYVETSFVCEGSAGESYSIVHDTAVANGNLYAVFSQNINTSFKPGSASALCVFKMADVNKVFNTAVDKCFHGNGVIGPEHFTQKHTCVPTSATVDYCGHSDVAEAYSSIEGTEPLRAAPKLVLDDTSAMSVLVRTEGQHTIAYIGTTAGSVLKAVVLRDGASILSSVVVDIRGPVKELWPASDMQKLIVLTALKVSLISVLHCEDHLTCAACVAKADSTCGWCIMQDRCTTKERCQTSAVRPHWLPSIDQSCARITNIQPDTLSYESLQNGKAGEQISFELEKVSVQSPSQLDLKCRFQAGHQKHDTSASIHHNTVTCRLPEKEHLPSIPQDHRELVLHFHVQGRSIVTRSVSLFDCRVHDNCTSCATSAFKCQWCYETNTCQKDSSTCQTSSGITLTDSCPRVEASGQDTDILVHSGEEKQIAVRVRNLKGDQNSNVKCVFTYVGKVQNVPGTITSSSLTCDSVKFESDDTEQPFVTASFKVISGAKGFALGNPSNIKVRIYKCPLMVTNCGKCLSMDKEYQCGWCDDKCTLQKHCGNTWLDRSAACPNPQILRFSPTTGPIHGKTNISVTGINLGKKYTDITGNVSVAGVKCTIHREHYQPSSRFSCETDISRDEKSGNIIVLVNGMYSAESDTPFYFVDPQVTSITPKKGPKSGGTVIGIHGSNMNTGSQRTVTVGGEPCEFIRSNKTTLECRTSQHTAATDDVEVEVSFGGLKKLVPERFLYLKDPTITMIEPRRSILSGGTTITVVGQGLDLIQKPEFFTTYGGNFYKTNCRVEHEIEIQCPVPGIMNPGVNVTDTSPLEVHYGFNMDGVMTLKNISHQNQFGPILYYPDPDIYSFSGDSHLKKYIKDDWLSIQGRFRTVNPLISNVMVYVGMDLCENPAATDTAITCKPPPQPAGIDNMGKATVEVHIGNLKADVGYLQYYEVSNSDKPIALGVILGVVLPILAIIILLTICVIRRHRKHGPSENYIPDVLKDYEGKKEEEEIGMNNVSIKADMNGQILDDKDSGPYIAELLGKFEDSALHHSISSMLIPRSRLDIGELIGKGHFGAVYKAQYQRSGEDKPIQVALKTLNCNNTEAEAMQTFLQDTAMLKNLQNKHILSVVGVCITTSEEPIIIMPFMATEDLKSYIREPSKEITVMELLDFGRQVAEGMVYLAEAKVVHRNLSARNCIVMEDGTVHLTDYGITSSLFSREFYFSAESTVKDLYKWMSIETLDNFEFSTQSDVWSFGIVLWELMTRGVTPYPDVDSGDLKSYLQSGKRMRKPKQCPEDIYRLMTQCWMETPGDRPTFQKSLEELIRFTQTEEVGGDTSENQPLLSSVDIGGSTEYLEVVG
ncbi:plexin-A4-like isoform X2 [Gigantopelta aegis]|uniref:plexin-A4-like isoform X2 n=1 Tax=Gigantopelta aegis TaxID=1735272 RepID=UPI001B8887EE|nr:plexin-A4-like isoform X2 [Gigantopelta aegis]